MERVEYDRALRHIRELEGRVAELTSELMRREVEQVSRSARRETWRRYFAALLGSPGSVAVVGAADEVMVCVDYASAEADKALEADDARWAENGEP